MPLTLVLGPANSAKAGEVLAAYAAAARRDAVLVVPTAADAVHYDRELAAPGVALGRALTFAGLLDEIARRAGFEAPRLTTLQRDRLITRTVAGLPLPGLGASARAAGFPAAAGRLIGELSRARVPPARFGAALRTWAAGDPLRERYAADVGSLPLRYAAALERVGRLDIDGFAWAALDALREAPLRWGPTPVFVYGFDDLTRIELDAIETLSGPAEAHVTVSLTYEPGRSALAARGPVVAELRALAGSVRQLESRDEHYEPGAREVLHHLERGLFEPAPARIDPGDAVTLLEAGGERAEAELIAAEVLAGLRAGVPAGEIVVVCRSLARSGALLERTLASYGVRASSERRVRFAHTALGRGLLALTRCAFGGREGGATADELLAYLRTPGVSERPEPVDDLAAAVSRHALGTVEAALAACPFDVSELDALRTAADPAAELAAQARRLLSAARAGTAAVLSAEEELDARAVRALLVALDELTALPQPPTGDELLELLAELEAPAANPAVLDASGAVLIAEPLSIRGRRFRRVLISGLCESEFPAPSRTDPFLGDDRRRELALASGLALAIDDDPLARERYLFYACASRASERLVLSYRSSDEDGNLVLPSPFLLDVAELFVPEWFERRRRRLLADVVWPAAEAPTDRERALAEAEAEVAGLSGSADPGGPPATRILGEVALGHVRHSGVVSGGALESFAACPVRWLVERQLQPAELEPDPEPLVRGDFMHRVLERVVAGLGGPVTRESLPEAERRLEELTADAPAGLAPGSPRAVRAAILRGIEADLRRYLRHESEDGSSWVPAALELRFGIEREGEEGGAPAVALGDGGERVLLNGVIDRIDVEPGGRRAIVRDYKSGANRPERAGARWLDGAQLQVGLYMIAVRRLLALDPVAGFYQPLTGRELRARGAFLDGAPVGRWAYGTDALDPAALDELLEEVERLAVELAATLRRGELTPSPGTCSRDGCLHPGICWAVR